LNLQKHKTLFFVVIAISALIVASPALQKVLVYPRTEFFTEMSLLGPTHQAQGYPYNITQNATYDLYLGLANHLGNCGYYKIEVKFHNATQPEADNIAKTPSSQPTLYNITAFIADEEKWEFPLSFSFDYTNQTVGNTTQASFRTLKLNGVPVSLAGYTSIWNSTTQTYYGSLSFELWIYNNNTQHFEYNQRFLTLRFNLIMPQ
jgi:hypothetical protein